MTQNQSSPSREISADPSNTTVMPPQLLSPRDYLFTRSFGIAAACYLLPLLLLFFRLFSGDPLHAGAQNSLAPMFLSPSAIDALPYVNVWDSDFVQQFSLFEEYQYRSAQEGRFPTWNPYIFCGQPFHGDGQSAMLNPFHWIYFWVDPNTARGPMTILRLWISALAMFCLLRRFSLQPTAAFIGGAVWIFSSFNMHWLLWPHTNASLWLPVVLLALDHLIVTPRLRTWAWCSLLIAPLFLAGHPGTEFISGVSAISYAILRLAGLTIAGLPVKQLLIRIAAAISAAIAGLLAAAAAWLPLYFAISRSYEYLDPAGKRGILNAVPWKSLWLFLVPEYFGRPRTGFTGFTYSGPENYMEMSLWFGAAAAILALVAIISMLVPRPGRIAQWWRTQWTFPQVFALLAFAVSLMITFKIWPVFQILEATPLATLTSPRRFFLAAHLAGAILAACTVNHILTRKDRSTSVVAAILALAACVLIGFGVTERWDELSQAWIQILHTASQQMAESWYPMLGSMITQYALPRMVAGFCLMAAGAALLLRIAYLVLRRRGISKSLRYGLAALVLLDVMLPSIGFHPITPLSIAVPPCPAVLKDAIAQTGDQRLLAADTLLSPNMSMHFGYRDVRGYDLPHDLRLAHLFQDLKIGADDNRGLITFDRFYPIIEPRISAYLNRTCVRTFVMFHPDPRAADALQKLFLSKGPETLDTLHWSQTLAPGNGAIVFENPNAYPRAYFASTAQPATDETDAMNALLNPDTDLRDRSVFEAPTGYTPPAVTPSTTRQDPQPLTVDKPEQINIATTSDTGGLLVLADRMDAGWTVTIDNVPATPVLANFMFRGVFVAAGKHTVEWRYEAPGLHAGKWTSIAVTGALTALLIALPLISWRRKRKTGVAPAENT